MKSVMPRNKTVKRLKNPDYYLPLLGAGLIAFCLYLIELETARSFSVTTQKVVGKVYYRKRVAQRKLLGRAEWFSLETGTEIYNQDNLRTEEGAGAIIVLNDGTQIEMSEKSMILLDISRREARIKFTAGSIRTLGGGSKGNKTPIRIQAGDKIIRTRDSDMSLELEKDSSLSVTLRKGDAELTRGEKKEKLKVRTRVRVSENSITRETLNIKPLSPEHNKTLFFKTPGLRVRFRWETNLSVGAHQLQVSKNREFTRPIFNVSQRGRSAKPGGKRNGKQEHERRLLLVSGTYFWRIIPAGLSKQRAGGEIRRLNLVRKTPLILYGPVRGRKYEYTKEKPLINFSWGKDPSAGSYALEISKDKDFKDAGKIEVFTTNIGRVLGEGNYYWRVRTQGERQEALVKSVVYHFEVTRKVSAGGKVSETRRKSEYIPEAKPRPKPGPKRSYIVARLREDPTTPKVQRSPELSPDKSASLDEKIYPKDVWFLPGGPLFLGGEYGRGSIWSGAFLGSGAAAVSSYILANDALKDIDNNPLLGLFGETPMILLLSAQGSSFQDAVALYGLAQYRYEKLKARNLRNQNLLLLSGISALGIYITHVILYYDTTPGLDTAPQSAPSGVRGLSFGVGSDPRRFIQDPPGSAGGNTQSGSLWIRFDYPL